MAQTEAQRLWKINNPERVRAANRRYREANKNKIAESSRKYRSKNRDQLNLRQRDYKRRHKSPSQQRSYKAELELVRLRAKYGFTPEMFAIRLTEQNGICAICRLKPATDADHCHELSVPRGILCRQCNHLLGLAKDNPEILRNAIEYLKEWCPHVDMG